MISTDQSVRKVSSCSFSSLLHLLLEYTTYMRNTESDVLTRVSTSIAERTPVTSENSRFSKCLSHILENYCLKSYSIRQALAPDNTMELHRKYCPCPHNPHNSHYHQDFQPHSTSFILLISERSSSIYVTVRFIELRINKMFNETKLLLLMIQRILKPFI